MFPETTIFFLRLNDDYFICWKAVMLVPGLGLECLVWLCIWHKPQVTKIPRCTGVMVSASSGNMYRHMVMALWFTYHLSSVSNLHLILGNLLGLIWVRGLGTKSLALALGPIVLVNITVENLWPRRWPLAAGPTGVKIQRSGAECRVTQSPLATVL